MEGCKLEEKGEIQIRSSNDDLSMNRTHSVLDSKKYKLKKELGLLQGFALTVGIILGTGIFISPGLMANDTSSSGMLLVIWVVAGTFAMMGSLSYCELATITKMSGGNYANILYIYGKLPAFLCAWTQCLVTDPSANAIISLSIGTYLTKPFYENEDDAILTSKIIGFAVILIAGLLNSISVKLSSRVQTIFSVAQISSISFVACVGIWQLSKGRTENFHNMFNGTNIEWSSTLPLTVALFGGLWSYDGWALVNNLVEEIKNVETTLLYTILTAFPFVICCYILVNVSFLTLLTHKDMSLSNAVGVEFIHRALGRKFSYLMMVLVGLSGYGSLNGAVFACPRLTLAAAREGHMPKVFSLIHVKSSAPIPSIILTTVISSFMLIPDASNLDTLILLFSQAQWLIYGSCICGVIILRVRKPDTPRPFKVFILIPIVASIIALVLVIIPFFRSPLYSLFLVIFIICGMPVYFIFVYHQSHLPNCLMKGNSYVFNGLQKYCNMRPCAKQDCI